MMQWTVGLTAIQVYDYSSVGIPHKLAMPVKIVEVTEEYVDVMPNLPDELMKEATSFLSAAGGSMGLVRFRFTHAGERIPLPGESARFPSILAMLP
jgi:hypothetical protein